MVWADNLFTVAATGQQAIESASAFEAGLATIERRISPRSLEALPDAQCRGCTGPGTKHTPRPSAYQGISIQLCDATVLCPQASRGSRSLGRVLRERAATRVSERSDAFLLLALGESIPVDCDASLIAAVSRDPKVRLGQAPSSAFAAACPSPIHASSGALRRGGTAPSGGIGVAVETDAAVTLVREQEF